MRTIGAHASQIVEAPAERCLTFLADLEAYPEWHPDTVHAARVTERDDRGYPRRAEVTLRLRLGPLAGSFELAMDASVDPGGIVALRRVRHAPSDPERFDVQWEITDAGGGRTRLELSLEAVLELPRLVPLGGVGEAVAQGFVAAASRALSDSSPNASASSS